MKMDKVEPREYLIAKNGYFYRPNRAGYTKSAFAAGLYTRSEALREARIEPGTFEVYRQVIGRIPEEIRLHDAHGEPMTIHIEVDKIITYSAGEWNSIERQSVAGRLTERLCAEVVGQRYNEKLAALEGIWEAIEAGLIEEVSLDGEADQPAGAEPSTAL